MGWFLKEFGVRQWVTIVHINLQLVSIILLSVFMGFPLINMDYALRRKWEMTRKVYFTQQAFSEVVLIVALIQAETDIKPAGQDRS